MIGKLLYQEKYKLRPPDLNVNLGTSSDGPGDDETVCIFCVRTFVFENGET